MLGGRGRTAGAQRGVNQRQRLPPTKQEQTRSLLPTTIAIVVALDLDLTLALVGAPP